MKNIDDILNFRGDISPFLTHLTRGQGETSATTVLSQIIAERRLVCGPREVSDARFGVAAAEFPREVRRRLFRAICFTETPLNEIHSLLEIQNREVNLREYGLVFLKRTLAARGVSPAIYINNILGDCENVFRALCLINNTDPDTAQLIVPLASLVGNRVLAPRARAAPGDPVDFSWEREWRYPNARGDLTFTDHDVFIGLCPHEEIQFFENLFAPVLFVDPKRNMKWYANKLIASRQRCDIPFSVV